jgi:hypothetical protein
MLELGDAAVGGGGTGEALLVQGLEGAPDGVFIEIHDRVAIGFLVGRVQERVQGERIVFGSGDFFFNESTEDADLGEIQEDVHRRLMIHKDPPGCRHDRCSREIRDGSRKKSAPAGMAAARIQSGETI